MTIFVTVLGVALYSSFPISVTQFKFGFFQMTLGLTLLFALTLYRHVSRDRS